MTYVDVRGASMRFAHACLNVGRWGFCRKHTVSVPGIMSHSVRSVFSQWSGQAGAKYKKVSRETMDRLVFLLSSIVLAADLLGLVVVTRQVVRIRALVVARPVSSIGCQRARDRGFVDTTNVARCCNG